MKKMFFAVVLTTCAALRVFAMDGIVRELSGDVELRHVGATDFVPASVGAAVSLDTIVSTGFRSNAIIEIGSTTLTVRPLTRLSLAQISSAAGTESLSVNLQAGRVRVDVRPPAGTLADFTVQSPSATASVRGTSFDFDARSVSVIEGSVSFSGNRGMPVIVRAGGESAVVAGGRAVDPALTLFQALSPSMPVGAGSAGDGISVSMPSATTPGTGNITITVTY
jgi:hypothetical protein